MTFEEAYENGLFKKGSYFFKERKGFILKNSPFAKKLRYRKRISYILYRFKTIDEDGRFCFDYIADISEDNFCLVRGSLSAGAKSEFDLKVLKNVRLF